MNELLDLALDRPGEARQRAEAILAMQPDPMTRSFACQALGIVLRDSGQIAAALRVLREGIRCVERVDVERAADVRATYAVALALAGRTKTALEQFECASAHATGTAGARISMRKAAVLGDLGRYAEASTTMRAAAASFRAVGDATWEGRSRVWLGDMELRRGDVVAAEREIVRATMLLERGGVSLDRLSALANLGWIAVARGALADGLRRYAEAIAGFHDAGRTPPFDVITDSAAAFVRAGLFDDAVALLDGEDRELYDVGRADLLLAQADVRTAAGDCRGALSAAKQARAMYRRQGRGWFELRARLAIVCALADLGEGSRLAEEAWTVAAELDADRAIEAPVALLAAARLLGPGRREVALLAAAAYRGHPDPLVRASAWLARALEREDAGDRGGALRACRAGLDAIDEQRRLLGSSELRAQATTHGRELTEVALRAAASDPRRLLGWAERTRATTLAQPRMTSDAATIPESLAALRDNGRQLAEARAAGEPTERLERERLRLERAVRAESHTVSAAGTAADQPATAEEVVAGVGDGCLVELVDVDGTLHVLVVHGGKVRRRVAGPTADALALLDPVAMLLRRSARGRPAATDQLGRRLQDAILGDAARLIPDGPVGPLILAPTTRLHGLPWAVLPALADRPFSVVPSAGQWLRARSVARPRDRRTVLVCGPGLESGGAEVPLLAEQHPAATLLTYKKAALDAVLGSIDGADLVHLAAHGHFRADSPLFSSLDLADGPLTVHDIERIGRAPYRVVLSACESGVLAPVGAQELLGLAAALFGLGTAGLVCSVAEVNDAATADLMVRLHAGLAAGKDPATALHEVRRDSADPVAAATAAAFLALGV